MKVTAVNNRRMIAISIVSITLILALSLIRDFHFYPGRVVNYALHIPTEIAYLLLLWFMISILQYNREQIGIQIPFSIFLGLEVVDFIAQMFFGLTTPILLGLGVLRFIILIYVAIASFRVKAEYISMAFRLFGVALLIVVFFKAGIAFLPVLVGKPLHAASIGIIEEVPLLSILYLLFQNERHLKEVTNSQKL